jgi:hypothetical protein
VHGQPSLRERERDPFRPDPQSEDTAASNVLRRKSTMVSTTHGAKSSAFDSS